MSVAFVLHSHLPWLRQNGTYPVGEEWLFQSWSESYLPVLEALERLAEDGLRDVLTVGITPVLAEQMDDPYLLREFHGWLGRRLVDLERTIARYRGGDKERLRTVWQHHWVRQLRLLAAVEERHLATGLTAPFRELADAGVIQLLGGPATHPYLALMDNADLIGGQIAAGMDVMADRFGRRPQGVWTPECAYRPAGPVGDPTRPARRWGPDGTPQLEESGVELPGLEEYWAEAGVDHFVVDGPTLAMAAGVPARDWSSTGGAIEAPGTGLDVLDRPVLVGDSPVAVFGRNLAVSYAVWNPHGGYPADPAYRDFYAIDDEGGFKSWRVTDRTVAAKLPYDPLPARERAIAHAREFTDLVHRHLAFRPEDTVVVAGYDTELFGHWWYEGPLWLEQVVRTLAGEGLVTTLSRSLEHHPPARRLSLPESSWGLGKGHAAWVSERTRWLWTALRDAERTFATLPLDTPCGSSSASGSRPTRRAAAWRQLCLLQASDWPFMINHDQSAQYAHERVQAHLDQFFSACRGEALDKITERDDPGRRSLTPGAHAARVAKR